MLRLAPSGRFKRDIKRAVKRGKDLQKLTTVLDLLVAENTLPKQYKDHPLKGDWKGWRDLHIEPDWIQPVSPSSLSVSELTRATTPARTCAMSVRDGPCHGRPNTSTLAPITARTLPPFRLHLRPHAGVPARPAEHENFPPSAGIFSLTRTYCSHYVLLAKGSGVAPRRASSSE